MGFNAENLEKSNKKKGNIINLFQSYKCIATDVDNLVKDFVREMTI